MDKREELYDFWRQESPEGNFFEAIPANPRSGTLHTLLLGLVNRRTSFLEVGCNVGRNLNHLYEMGYHDLQGIEINPHAVERLRASYPRMADVPVHLGTAEAVLPTIPTKSVDVVYTMAVLEHIHPDSAMVFGEIARIAKKYVVAIEPRLEVNNDSHRQHPWDVPAEYAKLGLVPIRRYVWSDLWAMPRIAKNHWVPSFDRFDAIVYAPAGSAAALSGRPQPVAVEAKALARRVAKGVERRVRRRLG